MSRPKAPRNAVLFGLHPHFVVQTLEVAHRQCNTQVACPRASCMDSRSSRSKALSSQGPGAFSFSHAATSVMSEPVELSRGGAYREMVVLVTVRWTVAVLSGGIPRGVAKCSCLM